MARSSARGYVEPLAAIAAVFAVVMGLSFYATAVDDVRHPGERSVAETVLDELRRDAMVDGVLDPDRLRTVEPPAGWAVNVTLASPIGRWSRGPRPPESADRAIHTVAVRLGPDEIRPAMLTVRAWQ